MKHTITLLFLFCSITCFAQTKDSLKTRHHKASNWVSFVTKLDIANATKDGIYLNGYVVNIEYEEAEKLNGKTIRVYGKVTIVKGIQQRPDGIQVQGRLGDSKHIESPKIEVIK